MPQHIIVIGDRDGAIQTALRSIRSLQWQLLAFNNIHTALSSCRDHQPALILWSALNQEVTEVAALRRLEGQIPIIAVCNDDDASALQELLPSSAEILTRPIDSADIGARISNLLARRTAHEPSALGRQQQARYTRELLYAPGGSMANIRSVIDSVTHLDCTVLIRGETGTGKELVARLLGAPAVRQGRPFVKVNCAALPTDLLEAELFGYERGAFTGAIQRKIGKFELAHHGVIFLDEIGEMSAPMQAKVLQVLQDREFSRLGGTRDTRVDVRIIAATHRDLEREIADGRFRQDLFFRLNVISIVLPPLRERRAEIPLLAEHFVRRYADLYRKPAIVLTSSILQMFHEYSWPGNVRELENVIQRMAILGSERSIQEIAQTLAASPAIPEASIAVQAATPVAPPAMPRHGSRNGQQTPRAALPSLKSAARDAAQRVERDLIVDSLRMMRWNRKETAKLLGVSYKTLLAKIRANGLDDETLELENAS
jgi:DNA-binding NtrC family response regulator